MQLVTNLYVCWLAFFLKYLIQPLDFWYTLQVLGSFVQLACANIYTCLKETTTHNIIHNTYHIHITYHKIANFILNVAFVSYKLTHWNSMLFWETNEHVFRSSTQIYSMSPYTYVSLFVIGSLPLLSLKLSPIPQLEMNEEVRWVSPEFQ